MCPLLSERLWSARLCLLWLGGIVPLLPTAGLVHCGGHEAENCAACPQGNGAPWCNGECIWWGNQCIRPGDIPDSEEPFPHPPDTRPRDCPAEYDDASLVNQTVAIVLPWLKERWEHMRCTMEAILHFTPDWLLEEIIFVSDGNEDSREKELTAMSPKVKVIALPERQGLIRAKMKGVEAASAPVIVFMEAHVIVNRDWLRPLLQRLVLNPRTLAMPALDIIPQDNFRVYQKTPPIIWRYEWNMNLITSNPGNTLKATPEPYMSPGTSGGIFAIRRDWFLHLGLFDVGMLEWGGDHFELTMKVWRCGGRIEIVPCSRIGHLFRDVEHRPYPVSVPQVVKNYKRLAHVWLKDHIDHWYRMKPEARDMEMLDMEPLHEHHDDLNCKNMAWYLENVDHEMLYELDYNCLPGSTGDLACKGGTVAGRSTVGSEGVMSREAYLKAKEAGDQRLAAEDVYHSGPEGSAYGANAGGRNDAEL